MKVFGCLAFTSTLNNNQHKFDPRARRYVFLGYPLRTRGYKLLDIKNSKFFVLKNIIFHEWIMSYKVKKNDKFIAGKYEQMAPGLENNREYKPIIET